MKIEKLRLKGFIGIKRGLGLDEIEIDFANSAGLVAFAGQNGLGKSTILENLHPYNTLASRSGALFNHVFLRDSEKELSFTYNGNQYRTLLKIDCQSGKSEGFIWRDGESIVNGKIRDYAKKIVEIFGSENLFFNSVFCSQNATKLSDMTTSQLKNLFAEFLRLDRFQEYEETSKQCINVLSGKAAQIDAGLEALQKRIAGAQAIKEETARLVTVREDKEGLKNDLNATLAKSQTERESLKEIITRNEVFAAQIADLKKALEELDKSKAAEPAQIEKRLTELRAQYKTIADEIKGADGILASEASIYAAAENEKACKGLIESLTTQIDQLANEITKEQSVVVGFEKDIQELKTSVILPEKDADIQKLNLSINSAKHQLSTYEGQLKALELRDPECASKTCSFIVAALKAQDELPGVKDALRIAEIAKENRANELIKMAADIGRVVSEKDESLKQARKRLNDLQGIQTLKRKELAAKRLELNQYHNMAEKQAVLAVAKSKKEDRTKALEDNKRQGQLIASEWKEKASALDDQIQRQQDKINEITGKIDGKAAKELDVLTCQIDSISTQIVAIDRLIADTAGKIAALQTELAGIQDAEEQLKQANEEKNRVNSEIADWTYIKNKCGKNGLQAMEIDGAAPLITGYANDLLRQAFGSLYTVKFLTQDEDGKECLDIITIGEDGEEVLLDNLSGGQKIWVLMALRLAMTLLSKEKGGRNFETAFFDEMDGALDPDNAISFIQLYKSFMDIGHFSTIPFISHKPECRSMADHVLMFEPGKNPSWN
ncbi:MAG: SMC family ATPase [Smithella sp.]|jgi:exonuclease SbcC